MAGEHSNVKVVASIRKTMEFCFRGIVLSIVMLLPVSSSCHKGSEEPLPPEMATLQTGPAGRDYQAFIIESTVESERFRRRLLSGGDPNFISANLLAKTIMEFRRQAPDYLKGHKDIDGFDLSDKKIIEGIEGTEHIESRRAYGGFEGKWYGQWDTMKVDHHWSEIVEPEPPRKVEIPDDKPVWIRSYQYCWVGDGYGLNMIATVDPNSRSGDFLLGYVVHVEKGDMTRPTKRRPHVGLFVDKGKLIWITAGEVFLEEAYEISPGVQAYAITGFFYKVVKNSLKTTRCFQAIYTRSPDNRPDWFSFPLELHVLH